MALRVLALGFLGMIPVVGPLLGLLNIVMIFGVEQRCLHDHLADTKVIKVTNA